MTDLQTLNPFTTKPKEQKFSPQNQIGGGMGFLSESLELGEFLRSPQQITEDGGQLLKEGLGFIGDMVKEDILGQGEKKSFSLGRIENFQTPQTPDLQEAELRKDYEQRLGFNNKVMEMKRSTDFSERKMEVETQARYEIAGMNDAEFAKEAGYKNTSFRGLLGKTLRTIANFAQVFSKRSEAIQKSKTENTPFNLAQGKLSALDRFTQARFASEQAGGQHVMSAVG